MATASSSVQTQGVEFGLRKERSLWSDAWRRLSRNKAAMAGLLIIIVLAVIAALASVISPQPNLELVPNNKYRQPVWVTTKSATTTGNSKYLLGTDANGRDMLTKLMYGGRVSLIVGLVPTLITITVGTFVGMLAGFSGGKVDGLLMRFTDVIYAFPDLLFIIIVMSAFRDSVFGQAFGGLLVLFFALSVISWTGTARLVRGQVLSLKEKEFVEAARAIGVSRAAIMSRHLFPNVLSMLIVSLTFGIPGAILGEAALGFLGIGIRTPTPGTPSSFPTTWGVLIQEAYGSMNSNMWNLVFAAGIIALVTLSFTFLGDGLRDALDPRQQK